MRLAYYAGASTAAAAACLLRAFHQRPNFYSATVYLSQSNACLLILTNLLLVTACSFMFALQRLLYGPLRPIEIEQLSEKAWYAVLDTLLAMPSFREDVGGWLLTMFVLLLAGKVWGWIGEGRVDVLEQQPPANPRLFHTRLATSLIVSVIFDIWMLNYCIETVVADPRPGMMVIFTFEFAILTIFSVFTLARYGLTLVDANVVKKQTRLAVETRKAEIRAERAAAAATAQQNPTEDGTPAPAPPAVDEPIEVDENEVDVPGWEEKRRYLFGLEVLTDFIKLVIYIVFFTVSITFNGLPMHIMRDVYMTFASFSKRVSDYVAYRKATSDMNTRYPDATTEEIRGDACIVCRETMVSWEQPAAGGDAQPAGGENAAAPVPARRRDEGLRAKKLPCGHILHLRCLKAWLERQQVCPTCRRPVVTANATANGAQPAANGQQRPQQPRARARMFNLGPLRVGLLNAPNDQMQNILNQIRNPEAANNQNADAANQQGPNHLGLQGQPYANGTTSSRNTGLRSSVPTHVQLLQLEQRIIQEAHNLGLEQQQLYNLRMMEAELSRLRAQHLPAQQPVGINGAMRQTPVAPQHLPHLPLPGLVPFQPFNLQQPLYAPPPPEVLQGSSAQQLGNESQNLPAGLTIPEGWTLMPLHRADAVQRDAPMAQELASTVQPTVDQHTSATTVPHTAVEQPVDHSIPAQSAQHTSSTGPTDEQGSPLFVPTPSIPQTQAPVEQSSSQLDSQPAPLKGDASWSFDHDASRASSSHETTNGHAPEQSGKGKARAVEVEDAPDEENR